MSVFAAVTWYADGDCPDVYLYGDLDTAVERIIYPFVDDTEYTEDDINGMREKLRSFQEVELNPYNFGIVLNLEVFK